MPIVVAFALCIMYIFDNRLRERRPARKEVNVLRYGQWTLVDDDWDLNHLDGWVDGLIR